MINLIPPKAKKSLHREYWVRVISVWLLLWSGFLFVGAFLLLPVYVLTGSQIEAYKDSADQASQNVSRYENVSSSLVQSSLRAKIILDESKSVDFSEYIDLFHSLEGDEIQITEIFIERVEGGISPIKISGVANGRQSLATFRDKVLDQEKVSEVDLPISNLARDKDIPFTITVTLNKEDTI